MRTRHFDKNQEIVIYFFYKITEKAKKLKLYKQVFDYIKYKGQKSHMLKVF